MSANPRRTGGQGCRRWSRGLAALAIACGSAALAQDVVSVPAAHLNHAEGSVAYAPQGEREWIDVQPRRLLRRGDRLWTDAGSRAEVQAGGHALRIDGQTQIVLENVGDTATQLSVTQGSLAATVTRMNPGDSFEVGTPNLAFRARQPGQYRIDVDPKQGITRVVVSSGSAVVFGEKGEALEVRTGQRVTFRNRDLSRMLQAPFAAVDNFDRWAAARRRGEPTVHMPAMAAAPAPAPAPAPADNGRTIVISGSAASLKQPAPARGPAPLAPGAPAGAQPIPVAQPAKAAAALKVTTQAAPAAGAVPLANVQPVPPTPVARTPDAVREPQRPAQQRAEAERGAEAERRAEVERRAEDERRAEARRRAEVERRAEAERRADAERRAARAEQERRRAAAAAEARRSEERKRAQAERRAEDERRRAQARREQEQRRQLAARRAEEERRQAQARRAAEEKRLAAAREAEGAQARRGPAPAAGAPAGQAHGKSSHRRRARGGCPPRRGRAPRGTGPPGRTGRREEQARREDSPGARNPSGASARWRSRRGATRCAATRKCGCASSSRISRYAPSRWACRCAGSVDAARVGARDRRGLVFLGRQVDRRAVDLRVERGDFRARAADHGAVQRMALTLAQFAQLFGPVDVLPHFGGIDHEGKGIGGQRCRHFQDSWISLVVRRCSG